MHPLSSISGSDWLDTNHDANLDADEAGIAAVTVVLIGGDGRDAQTTTAADGTYRFSDLSAGDYTVRIPAGPDETLPVSDTDGGSDSTVLIALAGEPVTVDFSDQPIPRGSITGLV